MSVKLIDNASFYGFRVRRSMAGELYQEYFSLKIAGKRATEKQLKNIEKKAIKRDAELEKLQQQRRLEAQEENSFRADGSVRGISYLIKREKSGTITPIFQVGVSSELEKKVVCTSFSINAHGANRAWKKAVDIYAKHKKIKRNTPLYERILQSIPQEALMAN